MQDPEREREWKRFLVDPGHLRRQPWTPGIPRQWFKLKCSLSLNIGCGVVERANLTSTLATLAPISTVAHLQRDNRSLEPALRVRREARRPWGPRCFELDVPRTSCPCPLFPSVAWNRSDTRSGHTAAQPYDGRSGIPIPPSHFCQLPNRGSGAPVARSTAWPFFSLPLPLCLSPAGGLA